MDLVTRLPGLNTSRGLAHFVHKRFGVDLHIFDAVLHCLLVESSVDLLHVVSQAIDEKGVRVVVNRLGHYIPAQQLQAPVCGCLTGASFAGLDHA